MTARNARATPDDPADGGDSKRQPEYQPVDVAAALQKRRDDLDAEPKDDSWAYYMEQTLTQFIARHPSATDFEISYVECRTTVCQIQAIGFDDSTGPTWTQINVRLAPKRSQNN